MKAKLVTNQVPISGEVSLYRRSNLTGHIKKLRKDFPSVFLAVAQLCKNPEYVRARNVLVRENNFGLIATLLAADDLHRKKDFIVSAWSGANSQVVRYNIERNILNNTVTTQVELAPQGLFDLSILVHDNHQSVASVINELQALVKVTKSRVVFVASHKNKGAKNLKETINTLDWASVKEVFRGNGGARLFKVIVSGTRSKRARKNIEIRHRVSGQSVKFLTEPSLFSYRQVDRGTDMLIKYILGSTKSSDSQHILDLGCGYGALGLSLLKACPNFTGLLSDIDTRAVELATKNANRLGLSGRVSVVISDGAENVWGKFDMLVSNPPLHISNRDLKRILVNARKKVAKKGRIVFVVENSAVSKILDMRKVIGYMQPVKRNSVYTILEGTK